MKGGDEELAKDFCDRAYMEANTILRKRKQRLYCVLVFRFCMSCMHVEWAFYRHVSFKILFISWKSTIYDTCTCNSCHHMIILGRIVIVSLYLHFTHDFSTCMSWYGISRAIFWSKDHICECRNLKAGQSIASIHGAVLALAASVLSVPYDMPRCVFFNNRKQAVSCVHRMML